MKKEIQLYVQFLDSIYTEKVEIEFENEREFLELADKESGDFYTRLLEGSIDYGWEEINV